jgi:DNA-directed RNA polymerase specialized sigma24 family protein
MTPRRRAPGAALRRQESHAASDDPLLGVARAYGADPTAAREHLERATAQATGRAAIRRALLLRLREDPTLAPPQLRSADRLPDADVDPALEGLDADERAILAGCLLDGLDANALAQALGGNRTTIKATARRLLAKLEGHAEGAQTLGGVASMMAGEYALGLLHPDGQRLFERGLDLDPELRGRVERWDARFEPLLPRPAAPSTTRPLAAVPPRRRVWLRVAAAALLLVAAASLAVPSIPGTPALPPARLAPEAPSARTAPIVVTVPSAREVTSPAPSQRAY